MLSHSLAKSSGNTETLRWWGDNTYSLVIASSAASCLGASCASHAFHFRCRFERDSLFMTVISFRDGLLYSLESRLLFITLSLWGAGQNKVLPDIKVPTWLASRNSCWMSRELSMPAPWTPGVPDTRQVQAQSPPAHNPALRRVPSCATWSDARDRKGSH